MVDDIMEKLPDPFNMHEIMGKVEERTPYVIVAFQVRKKNVKHEIQVGIVIVAFQVRKSVIQVEIVTMSFSVSVILRCHFQVS